MKMLRIALVAILALSSTVPFAQAACEPQVALCEDPGTIEAPDYIEKETEDSTFVKSCRDICIDYFGSGFIENGVGYRFHSCGVVIVSYYRIIRCGYSRVY